MDYISVCMATYNGEKFISEQVQSILIQLPLDAEFIISDDGSTDETKNIVNSFNDSRIKFIKNTTGFKGPVGNFSNALSNAKGDFIFLADQDDVWLNGKLKRHLELMQQYKLVISDAIVINENNEVLIESYFKMRRSKSGFINNFLKNSYVGCCMSFHKSLIQKALPFPKYIYMHDWYIGLIAELQGNVFFCDERFLLYRRHSSNASPTSSYKLPLSKRLKNRFSFIKALFFLNMRRLLL